MRNLAQIIQWKAQSPRVDFVVDLNWTRRQPDALEEQMYESLSKVGIVFVAPVGNDGENSISYPAAYKSVIAVGAVQAIDHQFTSYSNFGPSLNVSLVDSSEERRHRLEAELIAELSSHECADEVERYQFLFNDPDRVKRAIAEYVSVQHNAWDKTPWGTFLAAGAFSGYLANQLAQLPNTPVEKVFRSYKNLHGQVIPLTFTSGEEFDRPYDYSRRGVGSDGGCSEVTKLADSMLGLR